MIKEGVVKIGHTPSVDTGEPCHDTDKSGEPIACPLKDLLAPWLSMQKLGSLMEEDQDKTKE